MNLQKIRKWAGIPSLLVITIDYLLLKKEAEEKTRYGNEILTTNHVFSLVLILFFLKFFQNDRLAVSFSIGFAR